MRLIQSFSNEAISGSPLPPNIPPTGELSDRFWTIPTTGMTLPRIVAGVAIPVLALQGKNTTLLTALGAVSDKETPVADLADRLFPEAHLGRSEAGAELDYQADAVFGIGCALAALTAKNSPRFLGPRLALA